MNMAGLVEFHQGKRHHETHGTPLETAQNHIQHADSTARIGAHNICPESLSELGRLANTCLATPAVQGFPPAQHVRATPRVPLSQIQNAAAALTFVPMLFKASAKATQIPQAKATLQSWPSSWPRSSSFLPGMATAKRLSPPWSKLRTCPVVACRKP
jgi:hypothetical protein